jgi:hypothetical protein
VGVDRAPDELTSPRSGAAWTLFTVTWALAALFHLIGNQRGMPDWGVAVLGVGIVIALLRPWVVWAIVPLAAADILLVWLEAPVLGNHWLVAGFVSAGVLVVVGRRLVRGLPLDPGSTFDEVAPVARLILIGFYAFAAFAKLNHDFFDPAVSCATFYFRESTDSLGLHGLQLGGALWLQRLIIVATAATELSIPVLLLVRRTRRWWVIVALAFHFLLALDRSHQFFDFSSMLAALFLLFLPTGFAAWAGERLRSAIARLALRRPSLPELVHLVAVVGAALLVAVAVLDRPQGAASRLLSAGHLLWRVYALVMLVAVVRYVLTERPVAVPGALRVASPMLLVVPLLVVANGLTPYLEVKTAYGWNMYANLRTEGGKTNHLIVPRTFQLTHVLDDVVRIDATSDAALRSYTAAGYGLAFRQLRAYLARHPDVSLTYTRHGRQTSVAHAADDPRLVDPLPTWQEKLFLFRAVDLQRRERCMPAFGPAR